MSRNLARVGTVAIFFLFAACSSEVALPTAQATALQSNVITGNVVRLDGSASKDPQGRQLFFEWSFVSVATGSAATLVDANQMLPSFRADMPGDYVVQLVVSNGVVKSPATTVTVHVALCGFAPPTVSVATNSFSVLPGTPVQLSAVASDPDNQCLPANAQQTVTVEWQVNSKPSASSAIVSDPSSATPTFKPDVAGNYQLRITARDSTGLTSPAAFVNVIADACSLLAPTVSFAAPVVNGTTGTPVDLDPLVAKNNCLSAGAYSYSWSLSQRPSGSQAFLSNPTIKNPRFTPDVAGAYLASLTVTDRTTGISSNTAVQTVNVVRAACGFAAPQIVNARGTPALPSPGATVTLSATAIDRDNDPAGCNLGQTISFSWTPISAPSGSHAQLSDPSAAAPTFVADVAGSYAFTVVATDSDGLSSTPAGVTAETAACAPAVGAMSSLSTIIGTTANLVAPAVTDSCVANPTFTYQWTLSSRPAASSAVLSGANSSSASFTPDVVGDYQAQLVIRDQGGFASAPGAITIHAATCGTALPALLNLAATPISPNVGDTTTFSVDVLDPNAATCNVPVAPFHYSWSIVSKPRGSAASLALATSAIPVLVPDLPGNYQISVVVTDALGNSSDPAFLTTTTTNCGFFAPVAAITQPSPIATDSNKAVPLSATANSPDNNPATCPARFADTFSFSWSIVTSPGSSHLSSAAGSATSFTAASAGSYVVQVVAIASNGMTSAPASVTINVSACGSSSPAVVATSNNPAFPAPTQDVALAAVATDADTACGFPAPGLTWSIHSLPQGSAAVLQNPGGAAHFVPDIQGTYVFRVVATDSTGLSSAPAFVSVEALNPDPDASSVTAAGGLTATLVVADNLDPGTLTMKVLNAKHDPIAGLPVRIDSTGARNTFSPGGGIFAAGTTDVNGVFVATMVSTKAEVKTFTATANPILAPVVLSSHPSLGYVAGPTASIALTGLPATVTAGDLSTVTVTAFDQFLNVAKGPNAYTGTIHFTSNDPGAAAVLPTNFTFTPGDDGTHTIINGVRLVTAGSRTVTATDTVTAAFSSSQTANVNSAPAASIALTGTPANTTAGVAFSVTVTAHDAFNNVAKGPNAYTGTVHFTSTDAHPATLPSYFTFPTTDDGTHTFAAGVTLFTAGSQTVTATDTVTSTFTSSQTTTVNSAAAASIALTGTPANTTAGVAFSVTITAHDAFNNVAKGPNAYTGTVQFTSTDLHPGTLPANFTFQTADDGAHTFANAVTLFTAGSQTVTAKDTVNGALTSSQATTVNSAAAASIALTGTPANTTAGVAFSVTITAHDAFNNVAKGPNAYTGTVHFTSTDAHPATLPGDYTFQTTDDGAHTFADGVTLFTAGSQTITATDTVTSTLTSSQTTTVNSAAAASITLTGTPANTTAGVAFSVTVAAHDAFDNVAKGPNAYTGTVHFTSTDPHPATLPANFTFQAADDGSHTFTNAVTLFTVGSRTVTATDTVNGALTSSQTTTVNPAAAASFTVVVATNPAATAVPSELTVVAIDQFSNIATGYAGTVHFTSTDGGATLPVDSALTNGSKTFANGVTFNTVGSQTVTATDTVASAVTGTSATITVNAWLSTMNNSLPSRRLAVDPGTGNAYVATKPNGVFISTDHGSTWVAATTQPTDPNVEEIAAAPTSKLYAATATGGVFTSTDNGVTWSAANGTAPTDLPDKNTLSIVADPNDLAGLKAYVGTTTDVFVTADAGASWATTTFAATFADAPVTALAIDGAGVVYAGTVTGAVYSLTGTTWAKLTLTNTDEIDSLAANSGNLLAGTAAGNIFKFDGTTWSAARTAGTHPIFQIAFASSTTAYAASAGDGIFKTTDGGGTTDWTAANTGITNLNARGVAVDKDTATTVFAGTDGAGFFKTLSAGQ